MTETYCPLAWIGRNILPISIQPCCLWHGVGDDISSEEPLGHSPTFVKTRELMTNGQKVNGCKQCYMTEESGNTSRRQQAIQQYGVVTTVESKVLDISFDNLCNLKCRGCATPNSHLWYHDELEIYDQTFFNLKYAENNLKIDIENLDYIGISGGEPFLSKKFDDFANNFIKNKHCENINISINTNGTVLPSDSVYKLILECKSLDLQISIDGIGHLNSYFRSGSNFEDCIKTLNFFRDLKKIRNNKLTKMSIHTTVSVYNVNLLKEIEKYFNTNFSEFDLSHRLLQWPPQLAIRYLPVEYKNILIPIVEQFGDSYADVLYDLKINEVNHFDHFLNFHDKLDNLRSESLKDSNPLLSSYIKNYKRSESNSKIFFIKQMNEIKCGM
jgi:organic radical activating enzyme